MKSLKPERALPFDPREFAEVVTLGIAAGESADGAPLQVDAPNPDGSVNVLEVPDNPYSKATFALRRRFPDDDRRFASAMLRFRALMGLVSRGSLDAWIQHRDGGTMAIHPAVLDVASQLRISGNGRFAPRKFLLAVADVAQVHYPALRGWPATPP